MKLFITIFLVLSSSSLIGQDVDSFWIASNRFPMYSRDTGIILPDLSFVDEQGNKRTLAEFKGKILYIDVWATNCAPCIVKFPHASQLMKRLKAVQIDTQIQFVNICIEESKRNGKKFYKNINQLV